MKAVINKIYRCIMNIRGNRWIRTQCTCSSSWCSMVRVKSLRTILPKLVSLSSMGFRTLLAMLRLNTDDSRYVDRKVERRPPSGQQNSSSPRIAQTPCLAFALHCLRLNRLLLNNLLLMSLAFAHFLIKSITRPATCR